MTSRQEWRIFWTMVCGVGVLLCLLPVLMPSAQYPLLPFAIGLVLLTVGLWQRWRSRRRPRVKTEDEPL